MNFAEKIRKLLIERDLTQAELSQHLGLHLSAISQALARNSCPLPHVCLLLAGMTDDPQDRDFWLRASQLSDNKLAVIAAALNSELVPSSEILQATGEILTKPQDETERALGEMIRAAVADRRRTEGRRMMEMRS